MPEGEVLFDNSHWWYLFVCSVTQSCPTLCNSMDCSLPDSSVHGIFQARMLEWVGISFSNWYVWLVVWGGTETTVSSLETVSLDPSGRHWSFFCSAMSKYWHCMPKHSRISVYTQSHSLSNAQTTTVTGYMQFVHEQRNVSRDNNMRSRGGRKQAFIDLKRSVLISVITDKTGILQPPGGVRSGGRKAQRCTQRCWAVAPNKLPHILIQVWHVYFSKIT